MKKVFFVFALLFAEKLIAQDYQSYPMWNYNLPFEQRVNDLVSRLTLEEKVGQMLNTAPAIPQLGIPAYNWWNETLHGVARTPFKVTAYPQAIGMAATWDTSALFRMADYSAMEGRAIYNKALELGRTNERYLGLTYWTPNINIFRDPRWGRGQETYGEDPFLTAMLARSFVHGLQGDDPKYLKAAACAKHFAVHSGPEPSRHADNFNPTMYDLWDTYLPAFKELVVNAKVAGVMCAYNAVNSQPCCGNDLLMNDILRKQWKFNGYVTSDCWAIDDFFKYHKTHPDATAAAADAVMHGTDLECGTAVYKTLVAAVKTGVIKESQIDISLKRLFMVRYQLGMFDPVSMVKYAQTPFTALEAPEHKALALQMAREAIVLLKNQSNTLPLNKKIKRIAVLGPNADNKISILGNYNGNPSHLTTVLDGIKEKLGKDVEIIYNKAIGFTNDTVFKYKDAGSMFVFNNAKGVQAEYFTNEKMEGTPAVIQIENNIDHLWQEGQMPAQGIPSVHYSARYTTGIIPDKDETMNFEIEGDDGYRVKINDSVLIDAWEKNRWGAKQFKVKVKKNIACKIEVDFRQSEGGASIRLSPGEFVKTDFAALATSLNDVDAIVFAGGISPQLEGEEMPVSVEGFKGGDRTSISLPAVQTALMKALKATGKPIVFVMMTGSAIAVPWEDENIPAIVNAWYGGQSAGTAVADVLFGDYNPSGRLPVTFYKSDKDLPGFSDYSMKGRTYRYFKGDALYPFGYGLSYTSFKYDALQLPSSIRKGKKITVTARITNTGTRDGEEVVQLYIAHQNTKGPAPLKALKGFQRIYLKAGESRSIVFLLSAEQLSLMGEEGNSYQPSDTIVVSIGGGQPGVNNKTTSNVLSKKMSIK